MVEVKKQKTTKVEKEEYSKTIIWSENFQKIVEFYLFECPVEEVSSRATTFAEKGWKGHYFTTLKARMLNVASKDLKKRYYPCKKEELESRFTEMEKLKKGEEYCVFLKHDEKRVMESLYKAIRNAFAHGSFKAGKDKGKTIYYFSNFEGYCKAQIQLKESTLLEWIEVFNSDPEEQKCKKQKS